MHSFEEASNLEEMENRYTRNGSLDWYGRPCNKSLTGGWPAASLFLVNQGLATLAFFGISVNLVIFMTKVLHQSNAEAANGVSTWTGVAYIFSLLGAFASDSYWGRYKTCTIFQAIFVSGLLVLSFSSYFMLHGSAAPTNLQITIFYVSIYLIAIGNGGYQTSVATFGVDQFDDEDPQELESKVAFFSYFYVANNMGTFFSSTLLAYMENGGHWVMGFIISSAIGFLALLIFMAGTKRFRYFKPSGNPFSRVCQVIVASVRKQGVVVPANKDELHESEGSDQLNGGRKILHTPDFKFLDRAAVVTLNDNPRGRAKPWKLCTVTQVEELKCVLRLTPVWFCTITYSVVYTQMASVFVEQGAAMKNSTIWSFHIPPASMSVFEIIGVTLFIFYFRLCFLPFLRRRGYPRGPTELQRMGFGLAISTAAMVFAGLVEKHRLKHADGYSSSLSILWQMPQYMLIGASEVFMYVGQMEFFNKQAPHGLKSLGCALYVASMAAGSFVSSLLVRMTGRLSGSGWIAENLNRGHLDHFFFLLAALNAMDLLLFVQCAHWYRYIALEDCSKEVAIEIIEEHFAAYMAGEAAVEIDDAHSDCSL